MLDQFNTALYMFLFLEALCSELEQERKMRVSMQHKLKGKISLEYVTIYSYTPKNHKAIVFLSNTIPDPLKINNATKTPVTPEQSSHGDSTASKKNADRRWRGDDGPTLNLT